LVTQVNKKRKKRFAFLLKGGRRPKPRAFSFSPASTFWLVLVGKNLPSNKEEMNYRLLSFTLAALVALTIYMKDYTNDLSSYLNQYDYWSILFLDGFRYIYLYGPCIGPVGFWQGMAKHDICMKMTSVPSTHWIQNSLTCDLEIDRHVHSLAICFYLGLGCWLLYMYISHLWVKHTYVVPFLTKAETCYKTNGSSGTNTTSNNMTGTHIGYTLK
jgi:hypothetical protein